MSLHSLSSEVEKAEYWLSKADPVLGAIIQSSPTFDLRPFSKQPFEALLHAIIAQQLSVKAAAAIQQRVHALTQGNVTPEAFVHVAQQDFKKAGMSQAKINTLQQLIEFTQTEKTTFDQLQQQSDQQVKKTLCQLKGIGPWTVDIFLMFGLKRLDIFASGDLGLRKAVQSIKGLKTLPSATECEKIAIQWQPYRTIASWYLWRTLG
ncbi:MAG: DNA-3-methyladenine glycosylase 2 family protein [Cycloclasticus sp.]|nr:DNA-3-methyladenine glycosylase 2 family protein [Cycloclasticus sp.]MBQ0790187.1 DNA-3-methyladenine glycosylase 2 family protein [Cycloclasticus sp.]